MGGAAAHAAALQPAANAGVEDGLDDYYNLTSKEQCKNGGYKAFGFKNQGQCIRFVNTGKTPNEPSDDAPEESPDEEPEESLEESGAPRSARPTP